MDMRGLVGASLSFISNIFGLSWTSSDDSQIKQLTCDTCGKLKPTTNMKRVWGGICVCAECVDLILSLHTATNPIKTLCPHCHDKEGNTGTCELCDLPSMPGEMIHD